MKDYNYNIELPPTTMLEMTPYSDKEIFVEQILTTHEREQPLPESETTLDVDVIGELIQQDTNLFAENMLSCL